MAIQTKAIKQKMVSVGNIKKITKTMEMVSVSKMKRAISRSSASREYARYALELLVTLSKERNIPHPLLLDGEGEKTLLLIIASNKGLCGGYNVNISKAVYKLKNERHDTEFESITIGKQAERISNRNKIPIIASFNEFGEEIDLEKVRTIRKTLINEFLETKKYKNVIVVYTEFIKQLDYRPTVKEILPISPKTTRNIIESIEEGQETSRFDRKSMALYLFEPNEQAVLDKVLPNLLSATLFQIILEAGASEHSSRMVAMKNATDNAGDLLDNLKLTYNRARQASITQEVAEIIGGAEALSTN